MIDLLIQSEFEVATVNDHEKAKRLVQHFKNSILFINIESQLKEDQWEVFIRQMMQGQSVHNTALGIMVYNADQVLAQRYLIDIGVQCGFIQLKLGLKDSTKIVLKALEANEARGERRFVRVSCPSKKGSINIKLDSGGHISGTILDISSAGFACVLSSPSETGARFDDMQLSLWGAIIHAGGVIQGIRQLDDGSLLSVIMFGEISRETKGKIYQFIRKTLQSEIDAF